MATTVPNPGSPIKPTTRGVLPPMTPGGGGKGWGRKPLRSRATRKPGRV
jgi:hypothetical protein